MKTKELIEELNVADPSGEEEVLANGWPITYVENLPAYYDGALHVFHKDEEGNIKSGEIRRAGRKILLKGYNIEDALLDDPDLPVTFDEWCINGDQQEKVERWRQESKDIWDKIITKKDIDKCGYEATVKINIIQGKPQNYNEDPLK